MIQLPVPIVVPKQGLSIYQKLWIYHYMKNLSMNQGNIKNYYPSMLKRQCYFKMTVFYCWFILCFLFINWLWIAVMANFIIFILYGQDFKITWNDFLYIKHHLILSSLLLCFLFLCQSGEKCGLNHSKNASYRQVPACKPMSHILQSIHGFSSYHLYKKVSSLHDFTKQLYFSMTSSLYYYFLQKPNIKIAYIT